MLKLQTTQIGIEDGEVALFSDFEHDGPMWSGDGARIVQKEITFSEAFAGVPSVQVGLSMYDISNQATTRMDIRAEHITPTGFTISFRTWGDSKIARVRASWRAIGPLEDQDIWRL